MRLHTKLVFDAKERPFFVTHVWSWQAALSLEETFYRNTKDIQPRTIPHLNVIRSKFWYKYTTKFNASIRIWSTSSNQQSTSKHVQIRKCINVIFSSIFVNYCYSFNRLYSLLSWLWPLLHQRQHQHQPQNQESLLRHIAHLYLLAHHWLTAHTVHTDTHHMLIPHTQHHWLIHMLTQLLIQLSTKYDEHCHT